ncbi:MAG TPA: hypothetical protein VI522_05890, partial [Gammaproteobacteria bacterium]|nr:hypothetical protein [Gammaproteobacteria bacterium]
NEQIFIEYNADTGSDKKRKIPTHSIIEIFNNELNHTYRVSTGRWVGNHEIFESIADPTPMYNRAIQLEFDEAQDQEKYQFEHRALKEKATLMAEKMKEIHTLRKSTITKPWSSVSEEKLEVGDLIYLHRESLDQIPKLEAALGLSNANDNTPSERNANRYAAIWHLYLEYKDACKTLEDFVKHHNAAAKEKIQIARAKQLSPEKNTAIFQMAHLDLIAACFALYKENLPAIPKKQALALEEMANQLQDYARFREEVTRCFYDKPTHREKINVFWQNMNATMAGAKITLDIHPLLQKIIEKSHQENQIKIADIATLDVDAMNLSKENKKIFFDLIIKIPQLYTQLMERTQDKTSNPEEMYVSLWILYDAYQESCAKLQGMVNNFYFYESARSKLNQLAQWLRKNYPESKPTTLPAYTAAQGSGGEVLQSLGHEVADKLRAYDPSTQSMETLQELLNYISHLQEMTKNLTVTPDWVEEWHNIIDDGSPPREHILSFS